MATINVTPNMNSFRVVHPLDDVQEAKCSAEGLGKIKMTPAVHVSLRILRGYLILMTLMLIYQTLHLAGVISKVH